MECALVEGVSGNENAPRTVPIMPLNGTGSWRLMTLKK